MLIPQVVYFACVPGEFYSYVRLIWVLRTRELPSRQNIVHLDEGNVARETRLWSSTSSFMI
jgi:hypothetical protein